MAQEFSIPEEYVRPFRRILPYLTASLQNDPKVMESLVFYYKLGGEKLARIVIDALNITCKMQDAERIKKMREEAMLLDSPNEESDEDEDEELDDDEEDTDS
ncbi:MAG: hypothetical protein PVH87_22840 [Desulfobacteraceae bacterium]|jgi:hypothetical protein